MPLVEWVGVGSPVDLLTVEEAAAYLEVHRATLYRWVKEGLVAYYTVGSRRKRFRREDLDAAYRRIEAAGGADGPAHAATPGST